MVSITTLLVILLVIMIVGAFPGYGYNREWGYAPFGGLIGLLLIFVLLMMLGVLPKH